MIMCMLRATVLLECGSDEVLKIEYAVCTVYGGLRQPTECFMTEFKLKSLVVRLATGNWKAEGINLDRVRYEIPEVWNFGEEKKCGRLVYTAELDDVHSADC